MLLCGDDAAARGPLSELRPATDPSDYGGSTTNAPALGRLAERDLRVAVS